MTSLVLTARRARLIRLLTVAAAAALAAHAAGATGSTPDDEEPAGAAASLNAPGDLVVHVAGLRSTKGMIRACLTRNPAFLTRCGQDPAAHKGGVAAAHDARIEFAALPPGDYALAMLHDENGNGRLDTMFGIPKEGVGFSRDPVLRFGPPKWDQVRFHVPSGPSAITVTFKYFL